MKAKKIAYKTYEIHKNTEIDNVYLEKLEESKSKIIKYIAEKRTSDTKDSIILALLKENEELEKELRECKAEIILYKKALREITPLVAPEVMVDIINRLDE